MNEDVEDVRRMLAPANPFPQSGLTGAGQDAIGRAAFARLTTSGAAPGDHGGSPSSRRRFRLPRTGVRLVAVGTLAVTIAAGATVAQNLGGVDANGKPRAVLPGLPAGPVANAQELLSRAAASAQGRSFTAPRNDQWSYVETRRISPGKPPLGRVQTAKTPLKTVIDRTWTRADGKEMAFIQNGELVLSATGGAMPPQDYASLAALPRDPDALLAWVGKMNARIKKNPGSLAFDTLGSILYGSVLPPALEATIYRALAKIPEVRLDQSAVDVAGHPALGVAIVIEGYLSDEILLDPATYAYRGQRSIAIKDHTGSVPGQKSTGKDGRTRIEAGGTWTIKKGTIDVLLERTAAGIVDRPGQRQ